MKNWKVIKVNECQSTNSLMKEKKRIGSLDDKTTILTDFQSLGRGQGKNAWQSEKGKNLLASFYRKTNLSADKHFMLTVVASLAIHKTLLHIGIRSSIKWPNDIYVDNRKIAGILIENSLIKNEIHDTVIGIGLNINQQSFPDIVPNPVSIAQIIQREAAIKNILELFIEYFDELFAGLDKGESELYFNQYSGLLYRLKEWHVFEYKNQRFNGQIRGVMPDGRLIVEIENGQLKRFQWGDIGYVIDEI